MLLKNNPFQKLRTTHLIPCADEKPSFLLFGKYILFICYAFCESVDHEKCGQVKNTLKVECVDELW
jgi:hypothetical protein